jgi:hypothetical protein
MLTSTRLFGDGTHGHAEQIQTFRGPACRTTFSARRHTPLSRLKTPSHQIAVVRISHEPLGWMLARPNVSSAPVRPPSRAFLSRAGEHAQNLHERFFRTLWLPHLKVDELRTRLRSAKQVLWLWVAIDPCTRDPCRAPAGSRTQNMAHLLIHSLRQFLAPGCLPLFTSDGLNLYFSALPAHFGHWLALGRRGRKARRWQVEAGLISGQVKKWYRRCKLVRVTHVMRLGTEAALKGALQGWG